MKLHEILVILFIVLLIIFFKQAAFFIVILFALFLLIWKSDWLSVKWPRIKDYIKPQNLLVLVGLIAGLFWLSFIVLPQELPYFSRSTFQCESVITYDLNYLTPDANRQFSYNFVEFENVGKMLADFKLQFDLNESNALCWSDYQGVYPQYYYKNSTFKCGGSTFPQLFIKPQEKVNPLFKFSVPQDKNSFWFSITSKYFLNGLPNIIGDNVYGVFFQNGTEELSCTCFYKDKNTFSCLTGKNRLQ